MSGPGREREEGRALILAWHRVSSRAAWDRLPPSEQRYNVPLERFEEQLDALLGAGLRPVRFAALVAHVRAGLPLPPGAVCLSFDDGCESLTRLAQPALERRDLPAVAFVTTAEDAGVFGPSTAHGERRVTPDELRAWRAAGLEVGAHGVSHRGLSGLSPREALRELAEARSTLEGWLGEPVRTMSVPLDLWRRQTLTLAARAGYRAVCTSTPGAVRPGDDPLCLRRVVVDGRWDGAALLRSLAPWAMVRARAAKALKALPPRVLGERAWMPLRRAILDLWIARRPGPPHPWSAPRVVAGHASPRRRHDGHAPGGPDERLPTGPFAVERKNT